MNNSRTSRKSLYDKILICSLLAIGVLIVYWQVMGFEFVNFDDNAYVTQNKIVKLGITPRSIIWAFTSVYGSNWHPLTWISHMLDIQLFGMNPRGHHLTNIFFHILNTIFLFLVLEKMTGALWRSAVVAGLFALHPLHVESVAWIAERKDVLSTFFWMLTTMCYLRYVQYRNITWYILFSLFYLLGLLAKPMLVTLPFVLLLLDYWPLNRLDLFQTGDMGGSHGAAQAKHAGKLRPLFNLIMEKIPLMVFAIISSAITFYAQRANESVRTLGELDLGTRTANIFISYTVYLIKMVWPFYLAAFYPYPSTIHPLWFILSLIFFGVITGIVLLAWRKYPYLAVGWFWYIGTLVPVIGLVQVGHQSMADRYTYIPLIGIFIIMVWGLADLLRRLRYGMTALGIASVIMFAFLMAATWRQIGTWKDSETLFSHAIAVTRDNYLAHNDLGNALYDRGDMMGAAEQYRISLKIKPDLNEGHINLANILLRNGDYTGAIAHYTESLKTKPYEANVYNNLDSVYFHKANVYNNLGSAYFHKGNILKAIECFQKAVLEKPAYTEAVKNLENARKAQHKILDIITNLQKSIKVEPKNPVPYIKLGDIYRQQGEYTKAISHYHEAISIEPKSTQALYGLALVYSDLNDYTQALDKLQSIRHLHPDDPEIYYNIACIFAKQNNLNESIAWLRQAVEKGFKNWNLIRNDPDLENIRSTPYIRTLLQDH